MRFQICNALIILRFGVVSLTCSQTPSWVSWRVRLAHLSLPQFTCALEMLLLADARCFREMLPWVSAYARRCSETCSKTLLHVSYGACTSMALPCTGVPLPLIPRGTVTGATTTYREALPWVPLPPTTRRCHECHCTHHEALPRVPLPPTTRRCHRCHCHPPRGYCAPAALE